MSVARQATGATQANRFYLYMALTCALIAYVGFAPTYWIPVATVSFAGAGILHLHGLLFSAWPLLFVAQTALVATGQTGHHRALGLVGISLATAMVFAGTLVAVNNLKLGLANGLDQQNRAFSIVPISMVLIFASLVAMAIAKIPQPEIHKRLMLVATISVMPPAFARVFAIVSGVKLAAGHPPPLPFSLAPAFASDLPLVAAMAYAFRYRGRPHKVYVITFVCLLAIQIIRIPLASTSFWHSVTNGLLAVLG